MKGKEYVSIENNKIKKTLIEPFYIVPKTGKLSNQIIADFLSVAGMLTKVIWPVYFLS